MGWIIETITWFQRVISDHFSALTGLFGVYVGSWLTRRQMTIERKLEFYEKQLRELYSPLLGVRKEIQILSEFRLAGEKAQDRWWQDVCNIGKNIKDISHAQEYYGQEGKQINSQIEYEYEQLVKKIIPSYREMVNIFKNNYWLAEEETKEHFSTLIKFVETWERHLSGTHNTEVLSQISVSEEKLQPFYGHIEEFHNYLRTNLKAGKV